MNLALSAVPIARRRQAAVGAGLFAALFCAVGIVAMSGGDALVVVFGAVALLVAAVLALITWGVLHSVRLDVAERQLDAAIEDALAAGGHGCGCGHEHDPNELHVQHAGADQRGDTCEHDGAGRSCEHDGAGVSCEHDGAGTSCEHDCDTCVLASLRKG